MPRKKQVETDVDNNTEGESMNTIVEKYTQDHHLDLPRKNDNFVDWFSLIDKEYIVPNKDYFIKNNKPVPDSIDGLADHEKLILLGGFKKIAQIRGYTSVDYTPLLITPEFVSIKCTICWTPNFETGYNSVCFSALADAHLSNTYKLSRNFLTSIAENRAFVRAVRNFLNIPILGKDEIGPENRDFNNKEEAVSEFNNIIAPQSLLEKKMNQKNCSFEKFLQRAIKDGYELENIETYKDIPTNIALEILNKLGS